MSSVLVRRHDSPLKMVFTAPPDKAICQRAALLAALADRPVLISPWVVNADTTSTVTLLRALGAEVERVAPQAIRVHGVGLRGFAGVRAVVDAGNSATLARITLAVAAGQPGARISVTGNDLLRRRPMGWVSRQLATMGAQIDQHHLPITVGGVDALRPLDHVPEVRSAQAKSALLYAALFASGPSRIGERCTARDHTERLLRRFGVRVDRLANGYTVLHPPASIGTSEVRVAGDFSAVAPLLAAVLLRPPGHVLVVEGVSLNPTRTGLLRVLRSMGADVLVEPTGDYGGEPVGRLTARSGQALQGVEVAGDDLIQSMIDELPLLAVLAASATGTTVVRDAAELRDKDTDRLAGSVALLRAFGVPAEATTDGYRVSGPVPLRPCVVDPGADHRMVMAAAVAAATLTEPSLVHNAAAVGVSAPDFFRHLSQFAEVRSVAGQAADPATGAVAGQGAGPRLVAP